MAVLAAEEGRLPLRARAAEGELERLYARHAAEVRRYVQMVLRNRNDAEDVVQQTFLKALRALQQGVRPEKPRQWLFAIAHNECRMIFRQASRRPIEVDLESAGEISARGGSDAISADSIREALGQLAPNQRAALVMRELDDRSYAEIAETLGVTESAVETLLFRARRALREQLESAGDCDDAQLLIAAETLDDASRRRLRAHTRTCQACSTLERRRRGKLAAASRKVAALFPTPSWIPSLFGGGGVKAAAAIAAAAVAATGAAEAAKVVSHKPSTRPTSERLLHRDRAAGTVSPAIASSLTQLAPAKAQVAGATAQLVRKASVAAKATVVPARTDAKRDEQAAVVQDRLPAADDAAGGSDAGAQTRALPAAATTAPAQSAADGRTSVGDTRRARPVTRPTKLVPTVTAPGLPPLPKVDPPAAPATTPPLPSVPPLPEPTSAPQLPPAPAAPAAPQLPPVPPAPAVPPVPSVDAPPVPGVQTPTVPTLTKP
jgi:RNA polymerase sigma factor (sigma-70 family)